MTNTIDSLSWAHPLVREWFLSRFGSPTAPQEQGWPSILAGKATLIAAPTGSGKTFAAFLTCIEHLVRQALAGTLTDGIQIVYVSPLKALSNDIQKNLEGPLAEILALAKAQGLMMQDIRIAVRTGDTLARERQWMLKNPPHILVTTPESLYILLTAVKSRALLTSVHTLIVDEIHALAGTKRGTHLALSLERLQALTLMPPVRIGLSATQKPMEKIAGFLAGNGRAAPVIVDVGHARPLDLAIEIAKKQVLGPVASNEMWDEIYDRLSELAAAHRSTLIFVNTRKLAERIAHRLAARLGEDKVIAHHGSLSRKLRLAAETKLKNGELTALVATASLELGIDIGAVDLVCQIGSPRAIAVGLQRIGRAGHWRGAIPKGRIFATTRDELMECAALVYAIRSGDLDQLIIPDQPIDILSQQIIATCATGSWLEEDLFQLVKQAYPYAELSQATFDKVLDMLAEGIAGSRGRYSAYLFRDRINGVVSARRGSRLTAITNGGAIPENGLFTVIAEPEELMVGTLDEDFAVESNSGDIILLGSTSWRINRIESRGRVIVQDAHGAPPSVPFWRGEAPARTPELSGHVAHLRQKLSDLLDSSNHTLASHWLQSACGLHEFAAQQLIDYLLAGRALLGAVPTQTTLIAERFFDESGGMQLVIHSPFGARINKAWGLALRKRFCRSFNFELQAAATDDGLNISLGEQHSFPLADVFQFLHPNTVREVLVQAVLQSPLFNTRWRWVAERALALVRYRNGKKLAPNILRMLADDLLAAVFPEAAACQDNLGGRDIVLPDHPLINEVMKDVLTEALDSEGLLRILQEIQAGTIKCLAVDTPTPSPFAHEILNANPYAFLDDAPLEERRARAVELRRVLPDSVLQNAGRLDPEMIKLVQEQAWPDITTPDELHDALQTFIAMPADERYQPLFMKLIENRRAGSTYVVEMNFWWAAEKQAMFSAIYSAGQNVEYFEVLVNMLRGWMFHSGPISALELSQKLALPLADIDQALLKLETTGLILRGQFRSPTQHAVEWCERRLLARIHRLTCSKLRQEVNPVTAKQFMHWLLTWQHLAPGAQLQGESGLLQVIRQLQGFELPAKMWEKRILAPRIKDYDPQILDRLCLTGVVGWGRLSAHPGEKTGEGVVPSSVTPITFFVRAEIGNLFCAAQSGEEKLIGLSVLAQTIYHYLRQSGASFFADILPAVGGLKSAVETGLWELVAAGLVTADSFDNLRALIDGERRAGRRGKWARACYSGGRWSVLKPFSAGVGEKPDASQLEAACWIWLHRYGVVFRDLLARERTPAWRELLTTFRRLEDRGEIRGGRFVSGFSGEQFALPYAVESLRAVRGFPLTGNSLTISAVDPLNLTGIILPGERSPAISGKTVDIIC